MSAPVRRRVVHENVISIKHKFGNFVPGKVSFKSRELQIVQRVAKQFKFLFSDVDNTFLQITDR